MPKMQTTKMRMRNTTKTNMPKMPKNKRKLQMLEWIDITIIKYTLMLTAGVFIGITIQMIWNEVKKQ